MISYNEFVDYLRDEGMDDTECALAMYLIEQDYGDYMSALEAFGYEEADRETWDDAMRDVYISYEVTRNFGDYYECGSLAYYVFDDYDDAYEAAKKDVISLIDDIGVTSIRGWENYIDSDWFEDAMKESYESYCYDIEHEGSSIYDNRLVAECYDAGVIDDDDFELDEDGDPDYTRCTVESWDLVERLTDYLCNSYDDPIEWYSDNFGSEAVSEVAEHNNLYNEDAIAEYVVDSDGIGHTLASYDGYDIEYIFEGMTYYMYRCS